VAKMVEVFEEVRRVTRQDGTCFVNMGDSYAGGAGGRGDIGNVICGTQTRTTSVQSKRTPIPLGNAKPKDKLLVPWRLVLALQAAGWYVRDVIVWHKPAPMPESVTDRCTQSWEPIFLLAKSAKYYYDAEAVKEASEYGPDSGRESKPRGSFDGKTEAIEGRNAFRAILPTRNLRNVWTLSPEPFTGVFYDFQHADYVDDRGIPRKVSPSCPIHGQAGQPRQLNPEVVSCDEQEDSLVSRSECTRSHHDESPPPVVAATECCTAQTAMDSRTSQNQDDIDGSKTALPSQCKEAPQKTSRIQGIQERFVPSTTDYEAQQDSSTATSRSKRSSKTGRVDRSLLDGIASEETPFRTSCSSPGIASSLLSQRTDESSTPMGDSIPSEQKPCGTAGIYVSCNNAKCVCVVSQVSHFATFPTELPRRCIKAGTSEHGCCPKCGAPWKRIVEREQLKRERPNEYVKRDGAEGTGNSCANTVAGVAVTTKGWEPTCKCDAGDAIPCVVMDIFNGSGTSGLVARRLGRRYVGFELNPDYAAMARERITSDAPLFNEAV